MVNLYVCFVTLGVTSTESSQTDRMLSGYEDGMCLVILGVFFPSHGHLFVSITVELRVGAGCLFLPICKVTCFFLPIGFYILRDSFQRFSRMLLD